MMARTKKASPAPMDESELLVNSRLSSSLTQLLMGMGASLEPEREKDAATLKAEKSFAEFFRQAWPVMEPGVEYVHGWHIDAICEHLEAVSKGEIHKLLINMPPRYSKSSLVSVAFPAWEWIHRPWLKYLYSSYSGTLSIRDSVACRRLITSPWYQARWGDIYSLSDDQNVKMRFENSRHGVRIATSVGGTTTGEGGDRIVCFPYEAKVLTEHGPMPIGEIVEQRRDVRVWCLDDNGKPCLRPIERWNRNPGRPIVRVHISDGGTFECTADHKIRTSEGWKEAGKLDLKDIVPILAVPDAKNCFFRDPEECFSLSGRERRSDNVTDQLFRQSLARTTFSFDSVAFPSFKPFMLPHFSFADSLNVRGRRSEFIGQFSNGESRFRANVLNFGFGKASCGVRGFASFYRPIAKTVSVVLGTTAVGKVFDSVIKFIAVQMANLLPFWARAEKCQSNKLRNLTPEVLSIFAKADGGVPLNARGRLEDFSWDSQLFIASMEGGVSPSRINADSLDFAREALDESGLGNLVQSFETRDVTPIAVEFNIAHPENTYCLTVQDCHNFFVCSSVYKRYTNYVNVSNCDDPHNVKEAESETVRQGVLDWWHQAMSTRLNNPSRGAYIVVMQRVHDQDLSGSILERGGYEHLCLPCRYEGQKTNWRIGWQDPRTVEGELLWPERFNESHVSELEKTLGSYAAAAQLQQRPTPAEGGIFKRQWFRTYDNRPTFIRVIESWDTATSEKELSAYSVCSVWGETVEGGIYLLHVERQRLTFPQLKAQVVAQHNRFGGTGILVEDKSSGRQLCQDLGMGTRLPLIPVQVGKGQDKVARAMGCSAMIEAGRVYIPANAPWLSVFMQEVLTFPNCQYKDQVDSMTQALNYLKGGSVIAAMDLS